MTFDEFSKEWFSDSRCIEVHTSGSTGTPRRILLDKSFVERSARATNAWFSLGVGSRFHSCVAADFIGGKMMLVRSILANGVFSSEAPSNRPLGDLNPSDVIDLLAVVPSQMLHILENKAALPEIRNIIIGGSAIHPDLRTAIADSGLNCFETYGMTETASHIALRRVTRDDTLPFKVIGGVGISRDERGCLVIDYPEGEHIVTNDLVTLVTESSFLIDGRADDVIVTGGKKLNPMEVEVVLSRIAGCEVVVSSLPDLRWGRKVVAVVTSDGLLTHGLMRDALMNAGLEAWKCPKEVLVIPRIPRTPNGKVDRPALRRLLSDRLLSAEV